MMSEKERRRSWKELSDLYVKPFIKRARVIVDKRKEVTFSQLEADLNIKTWLGKMDRRADKMFSEVLP